MGGGPSRDSHRHALCLPLWLHSVSHVTDSSRWVKTIKQERQEQQRWRWQRWCVRGHWRRSTTSVIPPIVAPAGIIARVFRLLLYYYCFSQDCYCCCCCFCCCPKEYKRTCAPQLLFFKCTSTDTMHLNRCLLLGAARGGRP